MRAGLTGDANTRSIAFMMKRRKPDGSKQAPMVQAQPERPVTSSTGSNAVHKPLRRTRKAVAAVIKDEPLGRKQQEIWQKAIVFCVWNLPTLWTAGEPRQEARKRWIVPIVLRYLDGYEGNLGEMMFDEQRQVFTLLTDKASLAERARIVAASRPSHGQNSASPEAGA